MRRTPLKRNASLKSHTALRPGKSLESRKGLERKTPLRERGESSEEQPPKQRFQKLPNRKPERVAQEREYARLAKEHLAANPVCVWPGCCAPAVECHHARGRTGPLLTDIRYFRGLCQHHHLYATCHFREAEALGISLSRHTSDAKRMTFEDEVD